MHGFLPHIIVIAPARVPAAILAVALIGITTIACSPRERTPSGSHGQAPSNIPDPAPDAPGRPTAPIGLATDACAERLHALCGPLLYYYAVNRRLPERLDELRDLAGLDPAAEFSCPVSGQPYIYNPHGLPRGEKPGFLILYDAQPSHSGLRWAVMVEPPKNPSEPLVPKVVAEPEILFQDNR